LREGVAFPPDACANSASRAAVRFNPLADVTEAVRVAIEDQSDLVTALARLPEEVVSKIGHDALFRGLFTRMAEIALG
jgi:hypothetical protein